MVEKMSPIIINPDVSTQFTPGVKQLYTSGIEPNSSFGQEVELLKQSCTREQRPWYLLPQTGFDVRLQIDQFEKDLKQGQARGKSAVEILDESFAKIEQDIQGFKLEYLCEGLLFPIVLDKKIVNGRPRLVAPLYGDKLLIDTVSSQERRGAVKQALKSVEAFLTSAPPGSIAVMTSPAGASGFEGITYLDTQTYIWQVQTDRIRGFTVRTDMSLSQNRQLLTALGKDIAVTDNPNDQIVEIVASPVFIRHSIGQKAWAAEDVVDIIRHIKKSNFAYKNRPFDEIYQQLDDPQNLWTLDETTKRLTDELKTFFLQQIENGQYSRQDLEITIGTTILKLAKATRGKPPADTSNNHYRYTSIPVFNPYQAILEEVQRLPGCNGGGGATVDSSYYIFSGTLLPRHAQYSLASEKTLNCKCPFCNQQVDALITGGKIICPKCDKSAPYQC